MTKMLKRRSKKIGVPPGSLIYTGESPAKHSQLTLILYDSQTALEKHPVSIEEAFLMLTQGKRGWLHISGINDPHLVHAVGTHFKLHPLLLEDVMNPTQRSKLDDYKDHLYIAAHILEENAQGLGEEQLSMIIGKNLLISFSENHPEILKPIRDRLMKPASRMRQRGPDYLAYSILDCIVDNYFLILEHVDQDLESIENELLHNAESSIMFRIQASKRELVLLRKTIWPMRELINQFRRIDSPLIHETTRIYAYDVYDHTIQAIETVESFRDLTSGMLDIYLSSINQKMNETMKVLTVVATIFVPLTFISSLYGMNFDHMPELHYIWGYPITIGAMALITLVMLIAFRKKKWI